MLRLGGARLQQQRPRTTSSSGTEIGPDEQSRRRRSRTASSSGGPGGGAAVGTTTSSATPAAADQWRGRWLAGDAEAADGDSSTRRWRGYHGGHRRGAGKGRRREEMVSHQWRWRRRQRAAAAAVAATTVAQQRRRQRQQRGERRGAAARWRVAGPIDPRRDTTTVEKAYGLLAKKTRCVGHVLLRGVVHWQGWEAVSNPEPESAGLLPRLNDLLVRTPCYLASLID
ncbi:hypothetical protein Scep_007151 [Stephania cephalantha]|uniref:Uncharacterized protein n=1 Tax=Stephania cephalantha TaxID=152367 RepID=A0AAP0KAZ9_9MAGN